MKTLFAGPFIGEFGMELFTWQSHIRYMASQFDRTIISSRPECEFIYKDFCSDFIPFDPGSYNADGYRLIDVEELAIPHVHEWVSPTKTIRVLSLDSWNRHIKGTEQKFISYRAAGDKSIDFCLCARNFSTGAKTKIDRNWPVERATELANLLISKGAKIASVGLPATAAHIEGTENLLGLSLENLAGILSSCRAIIGPSSGLMHFATLCECPQIVWGETHLEKRYVNDWNPFGTPVNYICDDSYGVKTETILKYL